MASETLTVVFTDIKGFTARTSKRSRADLLRLLKKHESMLLPVIVHYGGQVVKTIGDAFLITFDSPTNAVICGLMMQDRLQKYNMKQEDDSELIEIRVAINTGEVERIGNDVFGEAVNIASRIEGVTDAGEVYFTKATYLAMSKNEVPTSEVGEFRLKGIPEPVEVYKVIRDENLKLYRELKRDQKIPEEVSTIDQEGSLSEGLLFTHERERFIAQSSLQFQARALIAGVLILLAGATLYLGYRSFSHSRLLDQADQLVIQGNLNGGLELLARAYQDDPTEGEILKRMERAVQTEVERYRKDNRYKQAILALDGLKKRYPYIEIYDSLKRTLRLEEIEFEYTRNVPKAREMMKTFHELFPNDLEIKFRYAYHEAESLPGNVPHATQLYRELVEAEPETYIKNEWIQKHFKYWLHHAEAGEDDSAFRELIKKRFIPAFEPFLAQNLYATDQKFFTLRRNAFLILKDMPEKVNLFRYFTNELFTMASNEKIFMEPTLIYFEKLIETSEWESETFSQKIEEIPALQYESEHAPRILAVLNKIFSENVKPFVLKYVGNAEKRFYRESALSIAKTQKWLTPEMTTRYHMANLNDYKPRFDTEKLKTSAQYFTSRKLRKSGKPALPALIKLKNSSDQIARQKKKRSQARPYRSLSSVTQRAIRNLKR